MIAVLDYGIGNLRSAEKALAHVGAKVRLVTDVDEGLAADAVVLPGVGAFGACAEALRASGLDAVARAAIERNLPFLGICVGFQLLFEGSEEDPGRPGLGLVPGVVRRLPGEVKLPQMQWNRLDAVPGRSSVMLAGLGERPWFYFVHSYAPEAIEENAHAAVGTCDYGSTVLAAIESGPLWGVQFHPEKSGRSGLALLGGFVAAVERGGELMQCLPAIDIRGGRCVRLLRGDFAAETVFGDPLTQARLFVEAGAPALHVVDLDAARGAAVTNAALVAELLESVPVPVQVGGGVRDAARAAALLEQGAARVVIGTMAVEEPDAVRALAAVHPGRIAIGLDHRPSPVPGGPAHEVALRGWAEGGGAELTEVLGWYADAPLGAVVVTNIGLDGTLAGPDLAGYGEVLAASALPIVASGGIGDVADLVALRELEVAGRRLFGAVIGRALLGGAMTVREAVDACAP